jgi:hypothetical protein
VRTTIAAAAAAGAAGAQPEGGGRDDTSERPTASSTSSSTSSTNSSSGTEERLQPRGSPLQWLRDRFGSSKLDKQKLAEYGLGEFHQGGRLYSQDSPPLSVGVTLQLQHVTLQFCVLLHLLMPEHSQEPLLRTASSATSMRACW